MAQTAHTPGPWKQVIHGENYEGSYIAIYSGDRWISEAKGGGGIGFSLVGPSDNSQIAANAALIAAAPDLLAALQACYPYMQDLEHENISDPSVGIFKDHDLKNAFDAANLAIQKATNI